jgi:hypothetical protein
VVGDRDPNVGAGEVIDAGAERWRRLTVKEGPPLTGFRPQVCEIERRRWAGEGRNPCKAFCGPASGRRDRIPSVMEAFRAGCEWGTPRGRVGRARPLPQHGVAADRRPGLRSGGLHRVAPQSPMRRCSPRRARSRRSGRVARSARAGSSRLTVWLAFPAGANRPPAEPAGSSWRWSSPAGWPGARR